MALKQMPSSMATLALLIAIAAGVAAAAPTKSSSSGGSRISLSKSPSARVERPKPTVTYRATTRRYSTRPQPSTGTGRTRAKSSAAGSTEASGADGFSSTSRRERPPLTPRQSLLPPRGAQPSPMLTQLIREKESSSGPGWVGTAFLVALLSRHDLSADDRRWIESRLSSVSAARGANGAEADTSPSALPKVIYDIQGLDRPLVVRRSGSIRAVAHHTGASAALPIECRLPEAAVERQGGGVVLTWTPERSASRC
ncbi:hypothetical protein [Chitinimonas koreensis]|uniref:hypothetical protein n=1 Tax=Chitinimonas koreensis TaxID=356302 RepID=UPI001654AAD2|nr:hypothetical protein [Chitinimonas koreensis]QNM95451.1 hypothetical protein H9L41_16480 [Chitinimonas koreensis]